MSLASILALVCLLLAVWPRDLGADPMPPAQDKQQKTAPAPPPVAVTGQATPPSKASPATQKPVTKAPTHKKKVPSRKKKKSVPAKPADSTAEDLPEKRVIRNGSATDPTTQISPSVAPQKASSQMQDTNNLLNTADANLKNLSGTQLNASQEEMVKQIKTYMEQAKTAAGAGDLERANNLATKAQLLSAELVKK